MFQIILDLLTTHLHDIKLIIIGIQGHEVVIYHITGLQDGTGGHRSCKRDLSTGCFQADSMEKVHIVRHSVQGVTRVHIRLQRTYLSCHESLDRLIVRSEFFLHLPVNLILVKRNEPRRKLLIHDLSVLDSQYNLSIAKVSAVISCIEHADVVFLVDGSPVVMRTDDEVHTFKTAEQVQTLLLKLRAVTTTGPRMDGNNHYIRFFLSPDLVHDFLSKVRNQGLEVDSLPELGSISVLDVRIGETYDCYLQTVASDNRIISEIRPAVVGS